MYGWWSQEAEWNISDSRVSAWATVLQISFFRLSSLAYIACNALSVSTEIENTNHDGEIFKSKALQVPFYLHYDFLLHAWSYLQLNEANRMKHMFQSLHFYGIHVTVWNVAYISAINMHNFKGLIQVPGNLQQMQEIHFTVKPTYNKFEK